MARSIARRTKGRLPRAVASLRIDGGTTYVTRSDRRNWHGKLSAIAEWVLDPKTWEARESGDGPPLVRLPMPPIPRQQSGLPGLDRAPEGVLDPRHLGWSGPAPTFSVHTNGGGKFFRLYVEDRIDIRFLRKKDKETQLVTWEVHAVQKARESYADDIELWHRRWLGWLGWLLHGTWPETADERDALWNVSCAHVNSDYVDLDLRSEDKWSFCGWRKSKEHGGLREELRKAETGESTEPEKKREEKLRRDVAGEDVTKTSRYYTDTLYFGRHTSDVEVCIYRKSTQLEDAKKVTPEKSMYAALWQANGWNGEDRVTRVEYRLRKKGLKFTGRDEKGQRFLLYDLTKPSMLLNREVLLHVWQYISTKRRLVAPKHAHSRLTRAPLDPAWSAVIHLNGPSLPVEDIRQQARTVRECTQRERMAKDLHAMAQSAISLATRHGALLESYEEIGAVLVAMGRRMMERGAPAELDALPRVRDVAVRGEYACLTSAFFSGEADALFEDFCEEVGCDLERVDWERASGQLALGDADGFSQSLARSTDRGVRGWVRDALTRPTAPTLPLAFRRGVVWGIEEAFEPLGGAAEAHEVLEHLRRTVKFQGEKPPEREATMTTNVDHTMTDLGDDKRFPQQLSPSTFETVREWVFKAITAEDDRQCRDAGVPPAFRRGVLLGYRDALEHVLPMAKAMQQPSLVQSIETMLEFVKLTGVKDE